VQVVREFNHVQQVVQKHLLMEMDLILDLVHRSLSIPLVAVAEELKELILQEQKFPPLTE
jgi:hypothetical protein